MGRHTFDEGLKSVCMRVCVCRKTKIEAWNGMIKISI